jgi:hypothetical protein
MQFSFLFLQRKDSISLVERSETSVVLQAVVVPCHGPKIASGMVSCSRSLSGYPAYRVGDRAGFSARPTDDVIFHPARYPEKSGAKRFSPFFGVFPTRFQIRIASRPP